jgi:hypothetical protein
VLPYVRTVGGGVEGGGEGNVVKNHTSLEHPVSR